MDSKTSQFKLILLIVSYHANSSGTKVTKQQSMKRYAYNKCCILWTLVDRHTEGIFSFQSTYDPFQIMKYSSRKNKTSIMLQIYYHSELRQCWQWCAIYSICFLPKPTSYSGKFFFDGESSGRNLCSCTRVSNNMTICVRHLARVFPSCCWIMLKC